MSEKTQKLYNYFSTDNPGLGSFDEFESALQDSSKRRKFYDHFSPDNPGLGTFDEFEQNVLPTPTDSTVTTPRIELPDTTVTAPSESTKIDTTLPTPPKKEEKQPEPIKQYPTDPGVYLAVADAEQGDRATRHNNFSAHIVPSNPELRQRLIDDYGMEVGDPFKDKEGNTLYTAKYPDAESGKAAGELIIDRIWEGADGDVEKFVEDYTGLNPIEDREEYASYLGKVQDQVKNSLEAQDLTLKDLTSDKLWSVEEMGFNGTMTGLPPKSIPNATGTDEFEYLLERKKDKNTIIDETTGAVKELATKKRYQENLQAVFGQNSVDSGGIKIEETDPEVKNIISIREELEYDTTMHKHQVAVKFMKDKWGVISKQNNGRIPVDRKEEYFADIDTFQTIEDTAEYVQASVFPLINKYIKRRVEEHNAYVEAEIKAVDDAMKAKGFAAKEGTEEAERIWQEYVANFEKSGRMKPEQLTGMMPDPALQADRPKFYTEHDVKVHHADGWTTGSPTADNLLGNIAELTTGLVGVAEFLTDNPVAETAFNMFYNNKIAPIRWLLGEENVPLARNQLGELIGLSDKRDFQPLDVLDEVTAVTSEYSKKYRRGFNAYFDNKGFWELASAGEYTVAGHYMLGQLVGQAPQIATVLYGGYALQSPRIATMLLSGSAGGSKYKELEEQGMPYLERIPYVLGEAAIEYATERFGTERLMRGLLKNRVAKEGIEEGIQSPMRKWYKESAKGFMSEGAEEVVAGLAQPLKDRLLQYAINGDPEGLKTYFADTMENAPNILEQFLIGGAAGGLMTGGGTLANNMTIRKIAEQLDRRNDAARIEQQERYGHKPDKNQFNYEIDPGVEEAQTRFEEGVDTRVDVNQVGNKFLVDIVQDGETVLTEPIAFDTQEAANEYRDAVLANITGETTVEYDTPSGKFEELDQEAPAKEVGLERKTSQELDKRRQELDKENMDKTGQPLHYKDAEEGKKIHLFRGLAYRSEKEKDVRRSEEGVDFYSASPSYAEQYSQRGLDQRLFEESEGETVEYDPISDPRVVEIEVTPSKILDTTKKLPQRLKKALIEGGIDSKTVKNIDTAQGLQTADLKSLQRNKKFFDIVKSQGYDLVKFMDYTDVGVDYSYVPLGQTNTIAKYDTAYNQDVNYINPQGKFATQLEVGEQPRIRESADFVGRIRRDLGEDFKDRHEDEIYDYLYNRGGITDPNYKETIEDIIDKQTIEGKFDGKKLNLIEELEGDEAKVAFDESLQEIEKEIAKLKRKKNRTESEKIELARLQTNKDNMLEDPSAAISNIQNRSIKRNMRTPSALEQSVHNIVTEKQTPPPGDDFKLSEAVRSLYNFFKIKHAEKNLPRKWKGYYKARTKKIRVQSDFDVVTATHEITHALDDRHKIIEKILPGKKYNEIKELLIDQYIEWYPGVKEQYNKYIQKKVDEAETLDLSKEQVKEVREKAIKDWRSRNRKTKLKEGLAVLVEHYTLNSPMMTTKYKKTVDHLIGENGMLSGLKGEGEKTTFQEDIQELINKIREMAETYQSLSPLERMKQPLMSMKRKVGERDKSGFSFWNKVQFDIFNMYEPVQRWSKMLGLTGTVDDPYTWSTMLQNGNTLAHNAIRGGGMIIINADGSMEKRDFDQTDVRKELKTVKDEEDFKGLLIARRYVGDYEHMLKQERALKNLNKQIKNEEKLLEKEKSDEGKIARQRVISELKKEKTVVKREYDRVTSIVNADHGNSKEGIIQDIKDANTTLDENYERFKKALDYYDKINNAVLEIARNTGLISKQQYESYLEMNQDGKGYYAPFYRYIFDEMKGGGDLFPNTNDQIEKGTMFKGRKGDTTDIINPIIGQSMNIMQIYNNGINNLFWRKVADMANNSENDELAERFNKDDTVGRYWVDTKSTTQRDPDTGEVITISTDGYYKSTGEDKLGKNYIKIYRNGTAEYYNIAHEFVEMSHAINYNQVDGWVKLIRQPASVFTRLTTSANPIFALGNFTIDQFTALMQTKTGYKPILDPMKYTTKYVMDRFGKVDNGQIKLWSKYMAMGGDRQTLAGFFDVTLEDADRILQGESKYRKYTKWINPKIYKSDKTLGGALMSAAETPSNLSEFASRFSEFARAKEEGKSDLEAMHMASQVTVNFAQMGAWKGNPNARALVRSIAFFNPALQVSWKYYQTMKDNPTRVATVGATVMSMVGAGLGAMLNGLSEEERKKYLIMIANMPVSELSRGIYFPYKDGLLRLRIPEQFGSLTSLAYMGVVNHYTNIDYKFSDYFEAITSFVPEQFKVVRGDTGFIEGLGVTTYSWLPTAVKPGLEALFNKRTFPKFAPLVPEHMQFKDPNMQYNVYTSRVARWVGELINVSPIKVEHYVRNQFGAWGGLAMWKFQANPMYRQQKDYIMKGKIWNDFYESQVNIKIAKERIKGGTLAEPKEHLDLHLESKLYNKMGETLKILRKLSLEKYDDLSKKDKLKAPTLLGSVPTISKKQSIDMFDLMTKIDEYDFSKHSINQNLKNMSIMMLEMKKLTSDVGKPKSLALDMNFLKPASKGKLSKKDYKNVVEKILKSQYVNGRVEAGQDRKRAINDWEDFKNTLK